MACGSLQAFLLAAALASYSPQLPAWAAIGSEHAFRPRRWQVALAHVDGQRAVEHREDDAEPLARRHAYADADAPSGLRAVTLADLSLDFDRAGNAIHYAREFQQCPVVDNGHTSVEAPLLRDEPLRADPVPCGRRARSSRARQCHSRGSPFTLRASTLRMLCDRSMKVNAGPCGWARFPAHLAMVSLTSGSSVNHTGRAAPDVALNITHVHFAGIRIRA